MVAGSLYIWEEKAQDIPSFMNVHGKYLSDGAVDTVSTIHFVMVLNTLIFYSRYNTQFIFSYGDFITRNGFSYKKGYS